MAGEVLVEGGGRGGDVAGVRVDDPEVPAGGHELRLGVACPDGTSCAIGGQRFLMKNRVLRSPTYVDAGGAELVVRRGVRFLAMEGGVKENLYLDATIPAGDQCVLGRRIGKLVNAEFDRFCCGADDVA